MLCAALLVVLGGGAARADVDCTAPASIGPTLSTIYIVLDLDSVDCVLNTTGSTGGATDYVRISNTTLLTSRIDQLGGTFASQTSTCTAAASGFVDSLSLTVCDNGQDTILLAGGLGGILGDSTQVTFTIEIGGTTYTIDYTIAYTLAVLITVSDVTISGGAFSGGGSEEEGEESGESSTPSDKSRIADSLLSSLISFGSSFLDEVVVTGDSAEGPNGLPFQFSAATVHRARQYGTALDRLYQDKVAAGWQPDDASFNFRVDLGRLARPADGAAAPAMAVGPGGPLVVPQQSAVPRATTERQVIPWVAGRYVDFADNGATDRDGHLWAVMSGLTVKLGDGTSIGAFGRYRSGEVASVALDSTLVNQVFGGGAFVAVGADGFRVKLGGLYEYGLNQIATNGDSGDFNLRQWTVEGRAEKRFQLRNAWWEPGVSGLYAGLDRSAYTDSGGDSVAASSQVFGRLSYGSSFGLATSGPDGVSETFLSINGNWTFKQAAELTLSDSTVLVTEEHSASVGGGFQWIGLDGATFRVRGDWFVEVDADLLTSFELDDRLTGWTVSGGLGFPLAAFGAATAGVVNFDASGNLDAANANARLTVPLN